jgi:ATP-binding cassette subfamily F protein 3
LEQYSLEKTQAAAQKQNLDKQIQHNQKFVNRFGAKASKAKQATSRKKIISRLQEIQNSIETEGSQAYPHISMPVPKPSAKIVLTIKDVTFGYEKSLVKNLNLTIERGQKIGIIGANGIGKSTMLKSLIGEIPVLSGTCTWGENVILGYYAQSQVDQLNMKESAFNNVQQANGALTDGQIRKILGSMLFKENDAVKPVSVMSGGEKSRVGLACLIAQHANVLLLDEPTNHLDMVAMEKLTDALVNYTGTIIFVSHDRRFINRIATDILSINQNGKYILSPGNLDDFIYKFGNPS